MNIIASSLCVCYTCSHIYTIRIYVLHWKHYRPISVYVQIYLCTYFLDSILVVFNLIIVNDSLIHALQTDPLSIRVAWARLCGSTRWNAVSQRLCTEQQKFGIALDGFRHTGRKAVNHLVYLCVHQALRQILICWKIMYRISITIPKSYVMWIWKCGCYIEFSETTYLQK